jgi:hypothetical protein
MTERFYYSHGSLIGDYIRAFSGIVLSATPMLAVSPGPTVNGILGILILLFSIFAARTMIRQMSAINLYEAGIASDGLIARQIAWNEIQSVYLSYFSTWRDKSKGWMQLKIKGNKVTLRIDSDLVGFDTVAGAVAECAARNDVTMNDITIDNFNAMGILVGGMRGNAT